MIMAKKLQITIDEESAAIMDNLKVKQIKSLFVNNAIKAYFKTKDGKSYIKEVLTNKIEQQSDNDENSNSKRSENHFLPKDKKVKLEGWN